LIFLEDLGALIFWLVIGVLSLNAAFIFFILYRRAERKRYFIIKDSARERYQPIADEFVANERSVDETAALLSQAKSVPEIEVLEELLTPHAYKLGRRSFELFFALGLVERWARQAFGKERAHQLLDECLGKSKAPPFRPLYATGKIVARLRYFAVPRALAVEKLAKVGTRAAHPFLAEALRDPAELVRRVAISSLGQNRDQAALELLVEQLRQAMEEGNEVSLRTMKTALIAYNLQDMPSFAPFLTHPHRRVRFFIIDAMREICARHAEQGILTKNDFGAELYLTVLDHCTVDGFADVRARSAYMLTHFRDEQSAEALRRLVKDENEFVRLHAVRACADKYFVALVPDLIERLTDTKWRVREAAVKSLVTFDASGLNELYRFFVHCSDLYSCEQISEEIQRAGVVKDLLAAIGGGGADSVLAQAVCQKMALMKRSSVLTQCLALVAQPEIRLALIEALSVAPTEEFLVVVEEIAKSATGALKHKAQQVLGNYSSGSNFFVAGEGQA
jgi:HEAT repeat protein